MGKFTSFTQIWRIIGAYYPIIIISYFITTLSNSQGVFVTFLKNLFLYKKEAFFEKRLLANYLLFLILYMILINYKL